MGHGTVDEAPGRGDHLSPKGDALEILDPWKLP
jgi:hypothetical protein